jgi:cytochrome P450 family 710 subfamily A protein
MKVRNLNLLTSQTVFVGPYIEDRKKFSENYLLITEGFLSFPINLPGTGLNKAVKARKYIVHTLEGAVR